MSSNRRRWLQPLLVASLILGAGIGGAVWLGRGGEPDAADDRATEAGRAVVVRTITARSERVPVVVRTHGEIVPRMETTLATRVSGEVVRVAESFEAGAFVAKGEPLLHLDRRDYELRVQSAGAEVARAKVRQMREEAEAKAAFDEWRELGVEGTPGPLAAREPQVAEARAAVDAADAELRRARLDLERTVVRAPFDGRMLEITVGLGQIVRAGEPIARLHTVDAFDVRLPVSEAELAALRRVPSSAGGSSTPLPLTALRARLSLGEALDGDRAWWAPVMRSAGEVDRSSRMVHLVARVDDGARALTVGTFLDALVVGPEVEGIAVPRSALRDDARVALLEDGALRLRTVEVVHVQDDVAFLDGVEPGEQVVVSPLEVAVDGMAARGVAVEAPKVEAPKVEAPKVEAPKVERPDGLAIGAAGDAP